MSPEHYTSDRVYRALKSDLLADRLETKFLNITLLSHQYGSSATPVREALLRLVGEGIVSMPPGGGFAPVRLTAAALKDLYDLNMRLLLVATKLANPPEQPGARVIADTEIQPPIDSLFRLWSERTGNGALTALIQGINDRLHSARLIESKRLPRLDAEYESLLASSGSALRTQIIRYHRRRICVADLLAAR